MNLVRPGPQKRQNTMGFDTWDADTTLTAGWALYRVKTNEMFSDHTDLETKDKKAVLKSVWLKESY
jgi:hypothetical protein